MRVFSFRSTWAWSVVVGAVWAAACGRSEGREPGDDEGSHAGKGAAGNSNAGGAGRTGSAGNGSGGSGGSGAAGSGAAGSSGSAAAGKSSGGSAGTAGDASLGGADATGGTTGLAGAGGEAGSGATGGVVHADKVDLLFVVDNSSSMSEKQSVLSATLPMFVARLVDPWCAGGSLPAAPAVNGQCQGGQQREIVPVTDMHVGVVTTSLGDHGSGDVCSAAQDAANQTGGSLPSNYDDHGRLLPSVRTGLPSWNGSGFLNWDAEGKATPPGESDVNALVSDLHDVIAGAGSRGCGYESTLEASYRFLVDPEPPVAITNDLAVNTVSTDPSNIDQTVLDQRAAFLRPDSAVIIVSLSDENDCSIDDDDGAQGWLVGFKGGVGAATWHMPRSSSACVDPNDPCCRPCGGFTPSGCPDDEADAACSVSTSLTTQEDALNLRCFHQAQRFGADLLYPLSRYVDAFTRTTVTDHHGQTRDNPLFAGGRDSRLVVYAPIVGVPWQDLAQDPTDTTNLELMSSHDLSTNGRWPMLVGDYANYVAPSDPFMIESIEPRSGTNPVTGASIVSDTSTDPLATINGHEYAVNSLPDDLQYACTFPLPTPIACDSSNTDDCNCDTQALALNRPDCQPPAGGAATETEYFGTAYPGIRHLELARELGERSVVSSICARDTTSTTSNDYGYLPAMRAIQNRLTVLLGEL
jgi:hypothetical protein